MKRYLRWRADLPDAVEAIDYGRTNRGRSSGELATQPILASVASGEKVMRRRLVAGNIVDKEKWEGHGAESSRHCRWSWVLRIR